MKSRLHLERARYSDLQSQLNNFIKNIKFDFTEHKEVSGSISGPTKKTGFFTKFKAKKNCGSFKSIIKKLSGENIGSDLLKILKGMIKLQLRSGRYLSNASYKEFHTLLNNVRSQLIELTSLKVDPAYLRNLKSEIAQEIEQILQMRKGDSDARTEAEKKLAADSQELLIQKNRLLAQYLKRIGDFKTELSRYAHLKDIEAKKLDEQVQKCLIQLKKKNDQISELEAPLNNLLKAEKNLTWEAEHKTKKESYETTIVETCPTELGYRVCKNCSNHVRTETIEIDVPDHKARELAKSKLPELAEKIKVERECFKKVEPQVRALKAERMDIESQLAELKKAIHPIQLYQSKFGTIFKEIDAVAKLSDPAIPLQEALSTVDDFFNQNQALYANLGFICNHLSPQHQQTFIELIGKMRFTQQSIAQFIQSLDPTNELLIASARQIKSLEMVARESKLAKQEKQNQQAIAIKEDVAVVRAEGQPAFLILPIPSAPPGEEKLPSQPIISKVSAAGSLIQPGSPGVENEQPGLPISSHRSNSIFKPSSVHLSEKADTDRAAKKIDSERTLVTA